MITAIEWHPKAECDLTDISLYYQHISWPLVSAFQSELDRVLLQLRDFPHSYPSVNRNLRCAFLTRFPYSIYYRILHELVTIIAVLPQRADPRSVMSKLSFR